MPSVLMQRINVTFGMSMVFTKTGKWGFAAIISLEVMTPDFESIWRVSIVDCLFIPIPTQVL